MANITQTFFDAVEAANCTIKVRGATGTDVREQKSLSVGFTIQTGHCIVIVPNNPNAVMVSASVKPSGKPNYTLALSDWFGDTKAEIMNVGYFFGFQVKDPITSINLVIENNEEVAPEIAGDFVLSSADVDFLNADGGDFYINNVLKGAGDVVSEGDTLEIRARDGYNVVDGTWFAGFLSKDFEYVNDKKLTSLYSLENIPFWEQITNVGATIIEEVIIPSVETYIIKETDVSYIESDGGTLLVNDVVAVQGTIVEAGDVVKVQAGGGDIVTDARWVSGASYRSFVKDSEKVWTSVFNKENVSFWESIDSINATFEPEPIPEPNEDEYIITQENLNYLDDNYCSLQVNGLAAEVGDILVVGDVVKITSTPQYKLVGAFWESLSSSKPFDVVTDDHNQEATFYNDGFIDFWRKMVGFVVEVELIKEDFDTAGTNNIYLLDDESYQDLMGQSFKIGGTIQDAKDYSSFLVNVLLLPISLPSELIGGVDYIKLADAVTTIPAPTVKKDLIKFDLGEIEVLPVNGNVLDYKDVKIALHLPFSEPIALDVNSVVGETIRIEFIVNVYDGTATVIVFSSRTGDVILSKVNQIGLNVPLANLEKASVELKGRLQASIVNGLDKAMVEVISPSFELLDGKHSAVVEVDGILSGSGYFEVDVIDLKNLATFAENSELLSQLKAGFYINE